MHSLHQSLRLLRNPCATVGVPRRSRSTAKSMLNRGLPERPGSNGPLSQPSRARNSDRRSTA